MTENTTAIIDLYAAFAGGDVPAVLSAFAADISWTEAEGFPYGGTYIGPEAIVENVFMKLGSEWDGFAAVPVEYVSEGDTVAAIGNYSGTYKATGKSFKVPFVHVWKFKDGKISYFHQHTDTAVVSKVLS